MSVFHVGKHAAVSVFVRFPSAFSVCVLAFKTTKIKDTKLTLRVKTRDKTKDKTTL